MHGRGHRLVHTRSPRGLLAPKLHTKGLHDHSGGFMRAMVLRGYGSAEELEQRELPEPKPGPGEVLVQVAAASINPIDWKLRSGALKAMVPLEFPAVLGRDVSGVIIAKGPGVTALQTGDRVLGLVQHGYAEKVVASADAFARLPEGFDLRDAAALPLVLLTGAQLIDEAVRPKRGQKVLITGALGSVGRTAVFVARRLGAHVFAGVRAAQKIEAAGLGCEGVIDSDDEKEVAALPDLDAIADTVGHETIVRLLPRLLPGGTLGSVVGEPLASAGKGYVVRAIWAHPDSKRLGELVDAVARGELIIPIAKRLPLAQAADAQRLAEKGGLGGKVLLVM
jgi:NADPH:quinone reductase-like Zn-dependent oxidoreductase